MQYLIQTDQTSRARFSGDLPARYFLEAWNGSGRTPAYCRVRSVNTETATFIATSGADRGNAVCIGIPEIGVLRGKIVRTIGALCTLDLEMSDSHRAGLVQKLSWLEKRKTFALRERRSSQRWAPDDPASAIAVDQFPFEPCRVVDISTTGALVSGANPPPVGARVHLGMLPGVVVRHTEDGYGIQFDAKVSDRSLLQDLISSEAQRRESAQVFLL